LARSLRLVLLALGIAAPAPAQDGPSDRVDFNRDVRPILSDACFACHGPGAPVRGTTLRLDTEAGRTQAVVPGRPAESELFRRVTSKDRSDRMPPARARRPLTAREIETLRRWIEQGAPWQPSWAFTAPRRPALPDVRDRGRLRNPIDWFVAARLEKEGLPLSPEAAPETLLRRITLDLTGLPPTPAEREAFLEDCSADAYEKVVDRLLSSPRYGERMAAVWLDAARYADSNGYQSDGERSMWPWRDWVVRAFNDNLPFDRFTIEQLAGDLLPKATLDQKIATGFNRNHRANSEAGIIPEEFLAEYVADRVDTTATVWLGLTVGCARCHDHKYDPVTQKEYYGLFAYFNNVPENGKAVKYANSPPAIRAPSPAQREELESLSSALLRADRELEALRPRIAKAQEEWEAAPPSDVTRRPGRFVTSGPTSGLLGHWELDGTERWAGGPGATVPGRVGRAAELDGVRYIDAGDVGRFHSTDRFSLSAWILPKAPSGVIVSRMTAGNRGRGFSLSLRGGKLQLRLMVRTVGSALLVETEDPVPLNRWSHVVSTYDGSLLSSGVRMVVDGTARRLKTVEDDLSRQSLVVAEPLLIGAGPGPKNRFRGLVDEVRLYGDALTDEEATVLSVDEPLSTLLAMPRRERTPAQALALRAFFLERFAPPVLKEAHARRAALQKRMDRLLVEIPTTMVMEEQPVRRDTFVLVRGEYDKHGEKVGPGVPAVLGPLPPGAPNNRLGFAQWLVDPSHPLTARVAVNRYWQVYFGAGLVRTPEDFGSQGEGATHPELLDWLAVEFVRSGWDVKAMQRLIVTSGTYRQSSAATPALLRRDPENRLLARAPRFRLSGAAIRDQALAVGGLLNETLGGPPVKPYQPSGLWGELGNEEYEQGSGAALHRRSLYTFWKRTVAPPTLTSLDAGARETCAVRETRTNTPLQALTLLNDVTFVEAARGLAQLVLAEGEATPERRLRSLVLRTLGRAPRAEETRLLAESVARHLQHYRKDPRAAAALTAVGESPCFPGADRAELAAWIAVAQTVLNLDETLSKE
jgi:hypothetical protein